MRFPLKNTLYLLAHYLLLVVSMLFAVQLRLQVPIGKFLPDSYRAQPPALYLILLIVGTLLYIVSELGEKLPVLRHFLSPARPFRRFVTMAFSAAFAIAILQPDISQLQLVYFMLIAIVFGIMGIVLPLRVYAGQSDLLDDLRQLWRSRFLATLWLHDTIATRYSQTMLGIAWIVLLPVLTSLVLTLAFSILLRIELDVPFISFFMAGLVPFGLFQAGTLNSSMAILSRAGLITQTYFPREVIVVVELGEAFVDFVFAFTVMIVINAILGIYPTVLFLYLPFLLLLLLSLTLGIMLLVSALSVLIQDIPQLITVIVQLLFYLTPVIYPVEHIPSQYRVLFAINPIASIVVAFRDVIVFQRAPNWTTLYYPIALSVILVFLGYSVFKEIEDQMADIA